MWKSPCDECCEASDQLSLCRIYANVPDSVRFSTNQMPAFGGACASGFTLLAAKMICPLLSRCACCATPRQLHTTMNTTSTDAASARSKMIICDDKLIELVRLKNTLGHCNEGCSRKATPSKTAKFRQNGEKIARNALAQTGQALAATTGPCLHAGQAKATIVQAISFPTRMTSAQEMHEQQRALCRRTLAATAAPKLEQQEEIGVGRGGPGSRMYQLID